MKFRAPPLSPRPFRIIEGVRLLPACAVRLRMDAGETEGGLGDAAGA